MQNHVNTVLKQKNILETERFVYKTYLFSLFNAVYNFMTIKKNKNKKKDRHFLLCQLYTL